MLVLRKMTKTKNQGRFQLTLFFLILNITSFTTQEVELRELFLKRNPMLKRALCDFEGHEDQLANFASLVRAYIYLFYIYLTHEL